MGTHAEIQVDDLPASVTEHSRDVSLAPHRSSEWARLPWRTIRQRVLDETERLYLTEVLRDSEGKIRIAAERAGMATRSFAEKMGKHGLRKEDFRVPRSHKS